MEMLLREPQEVPCLTGHAMWAPQGQEDHVLLLAGSATSGRCVRATWLSDTSSVTRTLAGRALHPAHPQPCCARESRPWMCWATACI